MPARFSAPLLLLAVMAAGCVSPRYAPSARHTPLMERAGEVQGRIEAGYGAGAAVFASPLPHLTVFVEGEAEPWSQEQVGRRRLLGGGGVGTYLRRGPYTMELLGGVAAGRVGVRTDLPNFFGLLNDTTAYTEARESRAFVQANLGVTQPDARFTGGLTLRLNRVRHEETLRVVNERVLPPLTYAGTFLEPGVFGRFGSGPVVFELSTSVVLPLARQPEGEREPRVGADWLTYKSARFGLGLAVEFGRFYGRRR